MYWIFGVKFVDLGYSCTVGGDPAMNIIIARVPVLNAPETINNGLSGLPNKKFFIATRREAAFFQIYPSCLHAGTS